MAITSPKTWKATTAGVLDIIAGGLNGLMAIGIIVAIIFIGSLRPMIMDYVAPENAPLVMSLLVPILVGVLVFSVITAVFPIIGGVFALRRRGWGWALAGSIIAIFRTSVLGILATIFVSMARDEFD